MMISMNKSSMQSFSTSHRSKNYSFFNKNSASFIYLITKFYIQLTISFILVIQLINKPLGIKSSSLFNSNNYIDVEDVSFSLLPNKQNSNYLKKINHNNHNNHDYSYFNIDNQNNMNRKIMANSNINSPANILIHSFNSFTTSSHHSKHLSRYNSTRLKIRKNSFIPSHRSMFPFPIT